MDENQVKATLEWAAQEWPGAEVYEGQAGDLRCVFLPTGEEEKKLLFSKEREFVGRPWQTMIQTHDPYTLVDNPTREQIRRLAGVFGITLASDAQLATPAWLAHVHPHSRLTSRGCFFCIGKMEVCLNYSLSGHHDLLYQGRCGVDGVIERRPTCRQIRDLARAFGLTLGEIDLPIGQEPLDRGAVDQQPPAADRTLDT